MRKVASALMVALLLLLAACDGGDGGDATQDGDDTQEAERDTPPVRGEIEVSVEPLALDELPEVPDPGTGIAVLGEETFSFAVTFCDESARIGTGEGEKVDVAWDLRDDGDHRVNIRVEEGNWVRGGPAEAEWDGDSGLVRFAGAFVPFRAEDGSDSRRGGIVVTCAEQAA